MQSINFSPISIYLSSPYSLFLLAQSPPPHSLSAFLSMFIVFLKNFLMFI